MTDSIRALFVALPLAGHFNPLVPIARALVEAGQTVGFATTEDFVKTPTELGFDALSFGPAGAPPVATLFDATAIDRLTAVLASWRPDVVIHDHVSSGAALASERAGVPNAYVSVGIMRSTSMMHRIEMTLEPLWATCGLVMPPAAGLYRYLYIDRCPPSLQRREIASIRTAHPTQPLSFDEPPGAERPEWLDAHPERRTVYVTLGTEFNSTDLFATILGGLVTETDLKVIATVGLDIDPDDLGPQPEHIYVTRFIPQSAVMARADLVICHGGSGAIMGSLTAGAPMLLLPQGADQFDNAPQCVERGVARALHPDDATASTIRSETLVILNDERYLIAAREVADEISRLPGLQTVTQLLKRLAHSRQPIPGPR
jgi:UDP:flavonoid glycosyltransferase YjiC (YdhE family)